MGELKHMDRKVITESCMGIPFAKLEYRVELLKRIKERFNKPNDHDRGHQLLVRISSGQLTAIFLGTVIYEPGGQSPVGVYLHFHVDSGVVDRSPNIEDDPLILDHIPPDLGVGQVEILDRATEDALEHVLEELWFSREKEFKYEIIFGVEAVHVKNALA